MLVISIQLVAMKRITTIPDEVSALDVCAKKLKAYEDLGSLLECAICAQRIRPTPSFVRQCTNGHFHCMDCILEMKLQNSYVRCAVCRTEFGEGVRNSLAQAYLEIEYNAAPVKCKFDKCLHVDFLKKLNKSRGLLLLKKIPLSSQSHKKL